MNHTSDQTKPAVDPSIEYIDQAIFNAKKYIAQVKDKVAHKHYTPYNTDLVHVAWRKFLGCGVVYTKRGVAINITRDQLHARIHVRRFDAAEPGELLR